MNVGSVATQEVDPMVEFREGIKLLKNEYPQEALVRFKRAFESDKHNAYYISFLGLAIARAQRNKEVGPRLGSLRNSCASKS